MPKECEESWEQLEALSKQMGLSEEQIKEQKKQFEESIKKQSKEEAIQMLPNPKYLSRFSRQINSSLLSI